MNEIKKFEVGSTYKTVSAYGPYFTKYTCVSRTAKTVKMMREDDGRVFSFRVVEFKGEEIIRSFEHMFASVAA